MCEHDDFKREGDKCEICPEDTTVSESPSVTGSAALLREMKQELRSHISEHELDDGEELDTETEDLILGWIDNFFENKIYDMEQEQ